MNSTPFSLNRTITTKLIRAWLEAIRLEELSNAKIEARDQSEPTVWEHGISLIGNCLSLDRDLFQNLKQQQQEQPEDFQIAVAFPKIYSIESGKRYFHPLFTIDVSSIFTASYSRRGWDLTDSSEFQPVLPNLIEFAPLDEEEAETLVVGEGLKTFLETTFRHPVTTLQHFLEQVSLPDAPLRSQPVPYLVRYSFVPYTYNLKKDLRKILQQQDWDWFKSGQPAYEYLVGRPQDADRRVWFAGAFLLKPPTTSQALTLKHFCRHSLTATIGAPGTGKTWLFAHASAITVVERALRLVQGQPDQSNLTLITSTNNRAVQNAETLFAQRFGQDFFYLSGGAKDLIADQVVARLERAISWLQTTAADQSEMTRLSTEILSRYQILQQALAHDQLAQEQRQVDERSLLQLNGDIQALEAERPSTPPPDHSQFPVKLYQQIQDCLTQIEQAETTGHLDRRRRSRRTWLQTLWQWFHILRQRVAKIRDRIRRQRLIERIEQLAADTHQTSFPFSLRLPLTQTTLRETHSEIAAQIQRAKSSNQETQIQTTLRAYLAQKDQLERRIANCPDQDFYDRFYVEFHSIQQELFELSLLFLKQEALRRKDEVVQSLQLYIDLLAGDFDAWRRFSRHWKSLFRDLSLLFPVMTSTLHSLRNLFPFPDCECIDRVFADEAGAIAIHQLFPALVRARKALVVGDPQQLPPVMAFSDETLIKFRQKAFLGQGLSDDEYDDYSPTAVYTANAYLRAAGASQRRGDAGNGIVLHEHFRCPPVIARLVDLLGNYGLEIRTDPIDPTLGNHLIGCHVEGNYRNYTNSEEIAATVAWVEHLYSLGYRFDTEDPMKTIGILTPFRNQAIALRRALQPRWSGCSRENVGTVHTYQGGQKAIMILSTCQCRSGHRFRFLNRKPNLLNVAVSRTQETLILVGNLNYLRQEGSYTKLVVEYIEQHGELRQIRYQTPRSR